MAINAPIGAEVVDVIVNSSHAEYKDGSDIGKIKAIFLTENSNSIATARWYKPLQTNFHTFPLKGEIVMMIAGPALRSQILAKNTTYYWFTTMGIHGDRNNNTQENSSYYVIQGANDSKGETFKEKEVKHLESFEGDTILQGRFNNTIRLGSSVSNDKVSNKWSLGSAAGDPILIITNGGAGQVEDANADASSITMTSTQKLSITLANPEAPATVTVPTGPVLPHIPPLQMYSGKPQVVIKSGRLIFNAVDDSIFISAKNNISLSTKGWKLDVTALCDILDALLTQLQVEVHASPCGPTSPPINAAIYAMLQGQLSAMRN